MKMHVLLQICISLFVSHYLSSTLSSAMKQTIEETGVNNQSFDYRYINDGVSPDKKTYSSTEDVHLEDDRYDVLQHVLSRTGFFLRIGPNGRTHGTSNCKDKYVKVKTFAVGPSLVVIKGSESGLYLSMDETGKVSARNNTQTMLLCRQNFDILWREQFKSGSCFVSLQSLIQFKLYNIRSEPEGLMRQSYDGNTKSGRYLSITKDGRASSSTADNKFKTHFFLMPQYDH
ncbi:fibroblast growth factor 16-like [Antedon mediterranea]|uniref:fibroblast growth factor 16-like n=1 Tax=Antedon mediterranea TaxID=105859 RepID=UPI003AF49DEC